MQVQSISNQNNQPHFNAFYKIPTKNITKEVFELVEKYNCTKCPSNYLAPEFWYILTPDTKIAQKKIEKAILKAGGKFWKADLKNILNKQICETIFKVRQAFDNGKEEWVEGKSKGKEKANQGVDLLF